MANENSRGQRSQLAEPSLLPQQHLHKAEQGYQSQIDGLKAEIRDLKVAHAADISQLQAEIRDLKVAHAADISQLQAEIRELQSQITDLRNSNVNIRKCGDCSEDKGPEIKMISPNCAEKRKKVLLNRVKGYVEDLMPPSPPSTPENEEHDMEDGEDGPNGAGPNGTGPNGADSINLINRPRRQSQIPTRYQ